MMTDKTRASWLVSGATMALLCVALIAPLGAFAADHPVSGTVKVGGALPAHAVVVTLWAFDPSPDPAIGGWWPSAYDAIAATATGVWSFPAVSDAKKYKAVFEDLPYYWYQSTVYPNAVFDSVTWDPSNGTTITPGVGSTGLVATMATLPLSLKGKVKNTAGAGLGGITVTVYDSAAPYDNWAGQTETLKDGTYELHGLVAGHSYRIAYEDYNGTYASTFYNGKATLLLSNPVTASGQTLSDTVMVHTVNVERIAPTSGKFWTQSVNVARRQYVEDLTKPYNAVSNKDVWDDVTDIILTSGDVRAQSDPLSAAGLAWAYQVNNVASFNYAMNAPLLLVSATSATDASVLALIREIGEQNNLGSTPKRLTIHIVGGAVAVPEARFTEISKALTNAGLSAPGNDRVVKVGGRYDLAAGIARRMKQRAEASTTDELQLANFALVANGADSARFFDSLALSPVAASVGAPILLVSATSVPSATSNVITTLKTGTNPISTLYIGGGPVAVSDAVKSTLAKKLPTNRISGANRYATARAIADKGIAMKWLYEDLGVAVASTIADAQLGGAMAGNNGEPLLLTGSTSLESGDKSWLVGKKKTLSRVYLVGSTTSLNTTVFNAIKAAVAN